MMEFPWTAIVSKKLRLLDGVFDFYHGRDSTARGKFGGQNCASWFRNCNKIVKDSIGDLFVKNPFISELLQIQLQTLQFNANLIGNVLESEQTKIGLSRFWANRCKFGAGNFDHVITIGVRVFECFKCVAEISCHRYNLR